MDKETITALCVGVPLLNFAAAWLALRSSKTAELLNNASKGVLAKVSAEAENKALSAIAGSKPSRNVNLP